MRIWILPTTHFAPVANRFFRRLSHAYVCFISSRFCESVLRREEMKKPLCHRVSATTVVACQRCVSTSDHHGRQ